MFLQEVDGRIDVVHDGFNFGFKIVNLKVQFLNKAKGVLQFKRFCRYMRRVNRVFGSVSETDGSFFAMLAFGATVKQVSKSGKMGDATALIEGNSDNKA